MDTLIYFIVIFLIVSLLFNVLAYAWPFLLIALVIYEIWKYFKIKKLRKQQEEAYTNQSSTSSYSNDNPDIIDVEYKIVDEENTGDDHK